MKRQTWSLASVLMLVTTLAPPAGAGEPSLASASEAIDPGKVHVRFKVRVFGLLSINGHFNRLHGKFVSDTQGGTTGVRMQIDAGSVTTDDAWRDDLLSRPSVQRSTVPEIRELYRNYLAGGGSPARKQAPSWLGTRL